MFFKLSNLNSNLALTLGYLSPALNNSAINKQHHDNSCSLIWMTLTHHMDDHSIIKNIIK